MLAFRLCCNWLIGLVLVFTGVQAFGFGLEPSQSVTLAWDPSPGTNIAGYRLYEGIAPDVYLTMLDLGNLTMATVSNLLQGVTYYFSVTAYDVTGLESPFSAPISYAVPSNQASFSLALGAGEPVSLIGSAPAGYVYDVQATTDLTNWTTIGNVTADSTGTIQFTDASGPTNPACFYRLSQVLP